MKKLMMVDDDVRVCNVVARIASRAGYEFIAVNDSARFMDEYATKQPDLIFLDIQMPNVDGIQLLRFLRQANSETPVYLLSGMSQNLVHSAKMIGQEGKLNVKGYIEKPIDTIMLEAMLNRDVTTGKKETTKVQTSPFSEVKRSDIEQAIKNNELELHYQPKISLKTGKIVGVEALARWTSPVFGVVPPDVFVRIAEESDLIDVLTMHLVKNIVVDTSLMLAKVPQLKVAVNISPALLNSLDFPDVLEKIVLEAGLQTSTFILEITETGSPADFGEFLESMTRMRLKGFELSLDDFGTGNSSTLQLFYLPISELKLDRRFVQQISESEQARMIVKSTIGLGRSFGVSITAEGIENYNTLKWLSDEGCEVGQGYFISRPLILTKVLKFTEFLESVYPKGDVIEASPFFQRGIGV